MKKQGLIMTVFEKCCKRNKKYDVLDRVHERVTSELDLVKFTHRIRLLVLTSLATLTPDQRTVASKMAQFVDTSSSSEEDDGGRNLRCEERSRE